MPPFKLRLLNRLAVVLYYKDLPGCWLYTPGVTNPIQWHMCVQITLAVIDVVINQYHRVVFLLVEGERNAITTGTHLLNDL